MPTVIDKIEALLREAQDAEALARLVSYAPDKARWTQQAERLRAEAERLGQLDGAPQGPA